MHYDSQRRRAQSLQSRGFSAYDTGLLPPRTPFNSYNKAPSVSQHVPQYVQQQVPQQYTPQQQYVPQQHFPQQHVPQQQYNSKLGIVNSSMAMGSRSVLRHSVVRKDNSQNMGWQGNRFSSLSKLGESHVVLEKEAQLTEFKVLLERQIQNERRTRETLTESYGRQLKRVQAMLQHYSKKTMLVEDQCRHLAEQKDSLKVETEKEAAKFQQQVQPSRQDPHKSHDDLAGLKRKIDESLQHEVNALNEQLDQRIKENEQQEKAVVLELEAARKRKAELARRSRDVRREATGVKLTVEHRVQEECHQQLLLRGDIFKSELERLQKSMGGLDQQRKQFTLKLRQFQFQGETLLLREGQLSALRQEVQVLKIANQQLEQSHAYFETEIRTVEQKQTQLDSRARQFELEKAELEALAMGMGSWLLEGKVEAQNSAGRDYSELLRQVERQVKDERSVNSRLVSSLGMLGEYLACGIGRTVHHDFKEALSQFQ